MPKLTVLFLLCFSEQGFSQIGDGSIRLRGWNDLRADYSNHGGDSATPVRDDIFILDSAPRSHPAYDKYMVVISPQSDFVKMRLRGRHAVTVEFSEDKQPRFWGIVLHVYKDPTD